MKRSPTLKISPIPQKYGFSPDYSRDQKFPGSGNFAKLKKKKISNHEIGGNIFLVRHLEKYFTSKHYLRARDRSSRKFCQFRKLFWLEIFFGFRKLDYSGKISEKKVLQKIFQFCEFRNRKRWPHLVNCFNFAILLAILRNFATIVISGVRCARNREHCSIVYLSSVVWLVSSF